jgi:methylated-DNA-[protein]-cysteine S-methyltransferase
MTAPAITIETPLGPIAVTERDGAIAEITIGAAATESSSALLIAARQQLVDYFARRRTAFDLPLAPPHSSFQDRMRAAMIAIPYGETRSYGDLAATLGSAARAVGQACGGNPIPIIVPCHRVLAAGGNLGGFSAGNGVATKRWLLDHEAATVQPDLFANAP